jgi:murein DD-endopeptidase MepM/ murein hydrolase activator NlpD
VTGHFSHSASSPLRLWRVGRSHLLAGLVALAAACGGDAPARLDPSSQITFGVDTLLLAPGMTRNLAPSLGGGALDVTRIAWATSRASAVQVSTTGLITAAAPGSATVTATRDGARGSVFVRVADDVVLGSFRSPLAVGVSESNVFDHDLPFEFSDRNGYLLSYWGEKLTGVDGHNGYDWPVPTGTPVLAPAAGAVTFAGNESPFFCPLLANTPVSGLWVVVAHGLANGDAVTTEFGHFSRIDVQVGQRVSAGDQLGLSGSTGCSTGPHLHFSVFHGSPADDKAPVVIDPYGWHAATNDPWAHDPRGGTSLEIWTGANRPPVFREVVVHDVFTLPFAVVISGIRYLGGEDDWVPNNEWIDIAANPTYGDADLSGLRVQNTSGVSYTFPVGTHLAAGDTLRLYSGIGTNSAKALYWGRTSPVWNNTLDCAELLFPSASTPFLLNWGGSQCPGVANAASSASAAPRVPNPADAPSPYALERLRVQPITRPR